MVKGKKGTKHTDSEHAIYAPSKFEQVKECPGSLILCKGLPDSVHPAAQVGEYAHDIGEHCIYNPKTMDTVIAEKTHEDNLPDYVEAGEVDDLKIHPKNYALYLLGLKEKLEPYRFEIEQRVELIDKKVWGRLDCGLAYRLKEGGDALAIIDYKHGRGVSVQAEGNWQLIIYGLAFARKAGIEPKKATLIVYQPRINGEEAIRRHTYTWDEMLSFEKQIKKAVTVADDVVAEVISPKYKAGKWCEFCKAKFKCGTYAEAYGLEPAIEASNLPAVTEFTDEQVVKFLRAESKVLAMFKAMRAYLIQRAINKTPVAGTKIVEGRTNRRWNGKPSDIAEYLETVGVKEPIETVLKLRGIGSIETEIAELLRGENEETAGKHGRDKYPTAKARSTEAWRLLESVVIKPEGKISIALEEDPRPAIDIHDGRILQPEDLLDDLE